MGQGKDPGKNDPKVPVPLKFLSLKAKIRIIVKKFSLLQFFFIYVKFTWFNGWCSRVK